MEIIGFSLGTLGFILGTLAFTKIIKLENHLKGKGILDKSYKSD
jgi:hypothetical protein